MTKYLSVKRLGREKEAHLVQNSSATNYSQSQIETAYCISSLPPDADRLLRAVRHHWRIENSLHWVLDVIFYEDDARLRIGDGTENSAILHRMVLNLLRRHPAKLSLKRKRFKAPLDTDFLFELLTYV